jgi:hypothetical protein
MTAKQLLGLYTIGWLLISLTACEGGMVTEVNGVASEKQCQELAGQRRYYYARIQKTCSYSN